jgi:uncharacterized protein YdaU (DUF1376 family)
MAQKPPAFQFYVKDWLTSPTVCRMTRGQRGDYICLLAAAWNSDEPGTLPLETHIISKMSGVSRSNVVRFMTRFPCIFSANGEHFVNKKLHSQWAKYQEISEKRSRAAMQMHMQTPMQTGGSASASASASARSKPNPPTPLPPASGGKQTFNWCGQTILVEMGRKHRLPNLSAYEGGMAYDVVNFLNRKGFRAEIVKRA